jgi:ABC-2 type transport system permease protein
MSVRRVRAALALELSQLRGQLSFVVLTVVAALTFLATMSLFGLTGSELPLAVVDEDAHGAYSERLVDALRGVRHAFAVLPMTAAEASQALGSGGVVGTVTIPAHFSESIARGDTIPLLVRVDNVNTDLTSDLERAIPNAILAFGQSMGFAGLRAHVVEKDLVARETGFLPYVAVSALGLDAFIIASVLGALAMAREWEGRTVTLLRLAPSGPGAFVMGKVLAASAVAALAMVVTTLLVTIGYRVAPVDWVGSTLGLSLCVLSFACVGACLGGWLKRTLAIVPLIFGLAMPLYIDCGALEPTRFDGEWIWRLAHLSPLYYATGLLEWTFHGLRVTPEPIWLDAGVLFALAPISALLARSALARGAR